MTHYTSDTYLIFIEYSKKLIQHIKRKKARFKNRQKNWLEKEMATHSSVLAWRIPGTGEPGGLPSMGLHRVRHDWSDLAAAAAAAELIDIFQRHINGQ